MREPAGARFLSRLAKSARKRWCGLTAISQDADDLLGSELGRAVVANAASQVLLRQAPQAIEQIGQAFNLTAGEQRHLLSCPTGQGLLISGEERLPLRVVASADEHSSSPADPAEPHRNRGGGGGLTRAAMTAAGGLLLLPVLVIGAATGGLQVANPSQTAVDRHTRRVPARSTSRPGSRSGIPWELLAGIGKVECDNGQRPRPVLHARKASRTAPARAGRCSSSPPPGPSTGSTPDGDDPPDRWNPADAIFSAANYLRASGAPGDIPAGVYAYNHSQAYVNAGARLGRPLRHKPSTGTASSAGRRAAAGAQLGGGAGGGRLRARADRHPV